MYLLNKKFSDFIPDSIKLSKEYPEWKLLFDKIEELKKEVLVYINNIDNIFILYRTSFLELLRINSDVQLVFSDDSELIVRKKIKKAHEDNKLYGVITQCFEDLKPYINKPPRFLFDLDRSDGWDETNSIHNPEFFGGLEWELNTHWYEGSFDEFFIDFDEDVSASGIGSLTAAERVAHIEAILDHHRPFDVSIPYGYLAPDGRQIVVGTVLPKIFSPIP